MATVTQAQNRRGIGTVVCHTYGFADEADISNIDGKPPARSEGYAIWLA